jgi:hypothetical protein
MCSKVWNREEKQVRSENSKSNLTSHRYRALFSPSEYAFDGGAKSENFLFFRKKGEENGLPIDKVFPV